MMYPEDPYTDEELFGHREKCEDEVWEDSEEYEDVEVSYDDYERRRIA